jgi:hypothetical protein
VGEGGGEEKNGKVLKEKREKRRNDKEKRNWELIG